MTSPTTAPTAPPARKRIFYGWYIIAISMVGGFLAAGSSQLFMGVMLKPITEDLGWTRTETSGAITLGTLAGGLIGPGAGWLTDRYGPRFLAPACAVVVVVMFFVLSSMNALWQFYAAYIVARGLCNSVLSGVVPMTLAANWFRKRRGRAMGLVSMALPLGGSVLALVGQLVIEHSGWRTVFSLFGIALVVLYVVPALLIIRRRPEDVGLMPDGIDAIEEGNTATSSAAAAQPELNWTLKQAVRTPALWMLIAGLWFGLLANGAIGFHLVAYYSDKGISATTAATALSMYGFTGAVANALWGLLVERVSERALAVFVMLASAGAVLFLLTVNAAPQAFAFALVFGLAARGESSLIMMMVAQYYGRASYGTINGFITPFQMLGLGLGPLVASIGYDLSGSYNSAFLLFAAFFVFSAVALFFARKPRPPAELVAAAAA